MQTDGSITPLVLESQYWQIGILPQTGGALAFGRIRQQGHWRDFFRPTAKANYGKVSSCASFVLMPWSNRLRDARFSFRGQTYQLQPTHPDGTAMHGIGRYFPWHVEDETHVPHNDRASITLSFQSTDWPDANFPFRLTAWQELIVEGTHFQIVTTIRNDDEQPFPAGFGHHPYFQRTLNGPMDSVSLEIPCDEFFELADGIPNSQACPISERLDFRQLRPLDGEAMDDCLTNRTQGAPVRFVYQESGTEIHQYADPVFKSVILYTPASQPFFAVEPVSNANDGFNLYDRGIPGSGVFVLAPGEVRQGAITFALL